MIFDPASHVIAVQDALGRRTTAVFDAAGRRVAAVDALGGRTSFGYDLAGRQVALVDARSNRYSFTFDSAGRNTVQVDPLGRRTSFTFDAVGQAIQRVDARGYPTTFAFDAAGRQTWRRYPDGSRVTQAYDAIGGRTRLHDSTGRYTTVYDSLERPSRVVDTAGKTITYTYDAVSRRIGMRDPDNGRFTYAFDDAGQHKYLVNPASERTTFAYNALGQPTAERLANGARASYSYDDAGQTLSLVNLKADGTVLSSFDYRYDSVGNRARVTEASGDIVTWSYDLTYQLTRERRSGASGYDVTYVYDPVGNRLRKIDAGARTTSTFDAANQLSTVSDLTTRTTYAFDAAGNQQKARVSGTNITTWTWDYENRLTKILLPASVVNTMLYNADGLRVRKEDSAGTSKAIWDGQNVLAETNSADATQALYTLLPQFYGRLFSQRRGASTSFYHFDALGSTAGLSSAAAALTDTYLYKAFGEALAASGATINPWRWVGNLGYAWDSDPAQYYVRARHFGPVLGRWLLADPLGLQVGSNKYRLVNRICGCFCH